MAGWVPQARAVDRLRSPNHVPLRLDVLAQLWHAPGSPWTRWPRSWRSAVAIRKATSDGPAITRLEMYLVLAGGHGFNDAHE